MDAACTICILTALSWAVAIGASITALLLVCNAPMKGGRKWKA